MRGLSADIATWIPGDLVVVEGPVSPLSSVRLPWCRQIYVKWETLRLARPTPGGILGHLVVVEGAASVWICVSSPGLWKVPS